jgi:hypothetical protein
MYEACERHPRKNGSIRTVSIGMVDSIWARQVSMGTTPQILILIRQKNAVPFINTPRRF